MYLCFAMYYSEWFLLSLYSKRQKIENVNKKYIFLVKWINKY